MSDHTVENMTEDEAYLHFCYFLLGRLGRPPSKGLLWHYTGFAGLEGILDSGEIFSTQHSCLNDSLEYLHLANLVRIAVRDKLAAAPDEPLATFYKVAAEALETIDIATTGHFVTCFSEKPDDIGQWRGYGGGECGYAIGFHFDDIQEAATRRGALLCPMVYDEAMHDWVVKEIIEKAELFYLTGLNGTGREPKTWAAEFQAKFIDALDPVISLIKFPKFAPEEERRVVTKLMHGEHARLLFRQRRTLMSRHLPLNLKAEGAKTAPVAEIMIGPGPAQRVTEVSVGDMLLCYGHSGVKITKSNVPYRSP